MENKGFEVRVCKRCGGVEFASHHMAYLQCAVRGDGRWIRYLLPDQKSVEEACRGNKALGPFECLNCGYSGDRLEDITNPMKIPDISISLIEKRGEDGLSRQEIIKLLDDLDAEEVFPIELFAKGHESSAIGFIKAECAEALGFDYDRLEEYIASILDDMENEKESRLYGYEGLTIRLDR